jgi:predicted kinase
MEAVVFIGVQASGKSTFYQKRFFTTHVRVSLDLLHTRNRERQFLETCLRTGQPFVIDNTNPTKTERHPYIEAAKAARFRIIGYYFQSAVEDCKRRNEQRQAEHVIPLPGLLGTYARLELPSRGEGFDELFYVRLLNDEFVVEEWRNEI